MTKKNFDSANPHMTHITDIDAGRGDITLNKEILICQGRCDLVTHYPKQTKLIIKNNGVSLKIEINDRPHIPYITTNMGTDDRYNLESIVILTPARHQLFGVQHPFEICFIHCSQVSL